MLRRLLPSVAALLALSLSAASAQSWQSVPAFAPHGGAAPFHSAPLQGAPVRAAPIYVADTPRGLNVRSGPGAAYPRIGVLARGEGGQVAGCEPTGRWCVLNVAGGASGWVYMPLTRAAARSASLGDGRSGPPVDWRRLYRPDVPYIHAGTGRINLRQGAGTHRRIVGKLQPGQGGFVQGCSADARWCLLSVPPYDTEGWVYMSLLRAAASAPVAPTLYRP